MSLLLLENMELSGMLLQLELELELELMVMT